MCKFYPLPHLLTFRKEIGKTGKEIRNEHPKRPNDFTELCKHEASGRIQYFRRVLQGARSGCRSPEKEAGRNRLSVQYGAEAIQIKHKLNKANVQENKTIERAKVVYCFCFYTILSPVNKMSQASPAPLVKN